MLKWTLHNRHLEKLSMSPESSSGTISERVNMTPRYSLNYPTGTLFDNISTPKVDNESKRNENKENLEKFFATPSSLDFKTPLQDISNSPIVTNKDVSSSRIIENRSQNILSPSTMSTSLAVNPSPSLANYNYACTLPTYDVEYSPGEQIIYSSRQRENPSKVLLNASTVDPLQNSLQKRRLNTNGASRKRSRSDMQDSNHDKVPEKRVCKEISNNGAEESLSSSKVGDVTLDKMLDAILESAKKDKPLSNKKMVALKPRNSKNGKKVSLGNVKDFYYENSFEIEFSPTEDRSVHEMEVKTPPNFHLKRQKVIRRKCKTTLKNENNTKVKEQKNIIAPNNENFIGLTLPFGIPSPETPKINESKLENVDRLATMQTPQDYVFVVDSSLPKTNLISNEEECSMSLEKNYPQGSSTPTTIIMDRGQIQNLLSARRCLSFSEDDSMDDIRRKSVTSSTGSVSSSSGILVNYTKPATCGKGFVDLDIFMENNQLNVNVIRCRDLQRSNGSNEVNAYVKVVLLPQPIQKKEDGGFQRTAVHRNSSRPYFNHRFKFEMKNEDIAGKRIQLTVWHRDRDLKRSEFLGCLSLPVKNVIQNRINGSFKLQPQSYRTNSASLAPFFPSISTISSTNIQSTQNDINYITGTEQTNNNINNIIIDSNNPKINLSNSSNNNNNNINVNNNNLEMAAEKSGRKSSVEEDVISIDSASATAATTNTSSAATTAAAGASSVGHIIDGSSGQTITLSKKAIHQRDADENLFLRFLELDPPDGPGGGGGGSISGGAAVGGAGVLGSAGAAAAASSGAAGNSAPQQRRMSTFKPSLGRTPFTITKRLTRTTEKGFGFSIVWTHPPRVEKIEPGLSADKNGILPGDYVIFVDKHNVVTMPEADVLNLIRSQGNTLTLEIFRRSSGAGSSSGISISAPAIKTVPGVVNGTNSIICSKPKLTSLITNNYNNTIIMGESSPPAFKLSAVGARSSTACSNASIETTKKKLHLPQVTFSKESIAPSHHGIEDHRRRLLLQLISREQNFVCALTFGMQRFVQPLLERKDLISPHDHRTLFQNIDELVRISEDILEQLVQDDHDTHLNFASRVYLSKTTAICAAYKKYCNGIKRADCVLVNKSRQSGSEFVTFITEPQVPRKRPDLTMLIHRPLQHFREILKMMQLLSSHCRVDSEEHKNFTTVINELQAAYREITVGGGLMEPLGEGRPLLTLQDLEARMVFTRCKPFTLAVQGRQWIFGGDLSRIEGRSIKPYWTLLFSDIIVFAKVSRDRVLFITEEPLPIANIVDSCFNVRKKTTEFRITVDPNGRFAESPTGYCAPDLTITPKKNVRRKTLVLRAPSLELKAVWQNLLQRQIFLVNAALGSTPLSSPLDSPDVLNTLVPLSDIGATTTSMASIKIASMDSINIKNQQQLQQQKQQQNRYDNAAQQIELLIDEKCRILNKTGTPKGSALHLANWMKGQLDKQQEQARLAAARSREEIIKSNGDLNELDDVILQEDEAQEEEEEHITFWTREQLEKRTKELNLAKENNGIRPIHPGFGGKRSSGVEEVLVSDNESDMKSPSRSTTSDSQITVRSSPNIVDKISVCRHCHKNCKQKLSPSPPLLSNSLKVQHSQSPNRCCQLNPVITSSSASTINEEEPPDDKSSAKTAKTTSSAKAKLLKTTSIFTMANLKRSCSGSGSNNIASRSSSRGILAPSGMESNKSSNSSGRMSQRNPIQNSQIKSNLIKTVSSSTPAISTSSTGIQLTNGNCSGNESEREVSNVKKSDKSLRNITTNSKMPSSTSISSLPTTSSITSTSNISSNNRSAGESGSSTSIRDYCSKISTFSNSTFKCQARQKNNIPCGCDCKPEDFINSTLSPDELKQETCKLIDDITELQNRIRPQKDADLHKNCKCICKNKTVKCNDNIVNDDKKSDDDISLVLIGLAQFTPAAKLVNSEAFVPTISIVPPTPDSMLSKTSINIWDNQSSSLASTSNSIDTSTTKLSMDDIPVKQSQSHEYITEDSLDESPQDEEPPYRALNTSLRRYGTMSSLERLASEDAVDFNNCSNSSRSKLRGSSEDDEEYNDRDGYDDRDEEQNDEHLGEDDDIEMITREIFTNGENPTSLRNWTARAGSYVAGKMSFFEESRAFIDKYLGRWNQEQENEHGDEEQMEECTSGATSGEEVWGTPTSGGENDDMQMPNSENTHSSPTRSSSSLNGDDDTELMMDELLMAPPMTASTIRGLLPRRRLEPLFEEETESEEEKTPQDNELVRKGEAASNGHDLEDSIGSLSDVSSEEENAPQKRIENDKVPKQQETIAEKSTSSGNSTLQAFQSVTKIETLITTTIITTMTMTTIPKVTSSPIPAATITTPAIVRRAKFSPPPPPPRRLLLTQSDLRNSQQRTENLKKSQTDLGAKSSNTADIGSSVGARGKEKGITTGIGMSNQRQSGVRLIKNCAENTASVETVRQSAAPATTATALVTRSTMVDMQVETPTGSPSRGDVAPGSRLSPRLEMRLALNNDILGDEDLISYAPGPDLTTILGHDLSAFHRLTGRDLLNRSANRIQPKEAVISYSQQRNSKMDTPTLNRKRQQEQLLHQNRNTWNNSAYADQSEAGKKDGSSASSNNSHSSSKEKPAKKLSDLEILAKREKIFSMSQLKSGSPARTMRITSSMTTTMMTSTSSLGTEANFVNQNCNSKLSGRDSDSDSQQSSKTNPLLNFLSRRNSDNSLTKMFSRDSLNDSASGSNNPSEKRVLSPRKDNDKPSLNRRFWKQLTKRRRAHSVSEIGAS